MLETLSLRSWCQHRKLDIELRPGLNGILGKNGHGKSNLLDGLRFAVTGQSINHGTLVENITWGEETASVELGFSVGKTRHRLKRSLSRTSKAAKSSLKVDGGETLNAVRDIADYLDKLWSTNTEALLQNVFLAQGAIDSILFAKPSDRYKEFQKTFGLENLEKAHNWLKIEANAHQVTPDLEQMLSTAVQLFEQARSERDQLDAKRGELSALITQLEPAEAVLRLAIEATKTQQAIAFADTTVDNASKAVVATSAAAAEAKVTADYERAGVDQVRDAATKAREDLPRLEHAIVLFDKAQQARATLAQQTAHLATLSQVPDGALGAARMAASECAAEAKRLSTLLKDQKSWPKLPQEIELEAKKPQLQAEAAQATMLKQMVPSEVTGLVVQREQIAKHLKLIELNKCPTCGAEFKHDPVALQKQAAEALAEINRLTAEHQAKHQATIDRVAAELAVIETQIATLRQVAGEAITAAAQKAQHESTTASAEQAKLEQQALAYGQAEAAVKLTQASIGDAPTDRPDSEHVARTRSFLAAFDAAEAKARQAFTAWQIAASKLVSAQTTLDVAKSARQQLGEAIQAPTAEQVATARIQVDQLTGVRQQLQQQLQQIGINQALLSQRQAEVDRLREKMNREAKAAKWVEQVKLVRDALHVTQLPTLVMREFARVLNMRMEEYLNLWESNFRLWLDDDLNFRAEFDGGACDAQRLSGGQKITAAASFRLAMSDTFAASVGLLILDEPSVYLDKDNIQHLQVLLLKLKEMSTHSGRQILVVTHEESLMGFMDHVIQV